MSTRLCNVDLRPDAFVVIPYSQTTDGFWVIDGDAVRLEPDAQLGTLGNAIRNALNSSRQDLPAPPSEAPLDRQLLALFGAPDYAAYAKGAKSVGVRSTSGDGAETIKITPKKNGGPSKGFVPLRDAQSTLTYGSPGQLGTAVVQALRSATA